MTTTIEPTISPASHDYHAVMVVTAELSDIPAKLRYRNRNWRYQPERIVVRYEDHGDGWNPRSWVTLHGPRIRKDGSFGQEVEETLWSDVMPPWAARFLAEHIPTSHPSA